MQSLKGKRIGLSNSLKNKFGTSHPAIVSPNGEIYDNIDNMAKFSREHGLDTDAMYALTAGDRSSVSGWKLLVPKLI